MEFFPLFSVFLFGGWRFYTLEVFFFFFFRGPGGPQFRSPEFTAVAMDPKTLGGFTSSGSSFFSPFLFPPAAEDFENFRPDFSPPHSSLPFRS